MWVIYLFIFTKSFSVTGRPVKLEWVAASHNRCAKKEKLERGKVCQRMTVCRELFRNWKWCCYLLVAGLQPETHRDDSWPIIFFSSPAFCLLHSFCADIFAWLESDLLFSKPLVIQYFPFFPACVCRQSVSKLAVTCRPQHNNDTCGCFKNSVAVALFSFQFERCLRHQRLFENISAVIMSCNFLQSDQ